MIYNFTYSGKEKRKLYRRQELKVGPAFNASRSEDEALRNKT